MKNHKFPYNWRIADGYPAKGIEKHGCRVFGTFICGGGSSMGYKLAGFDHLGGVELDPDVAMCYKHNHHPKYLFNEDIRKFNERQDLPEELYGIDLLDGSPPCSTFSMAGSREDAWGKEKVFREGQAKQVLDDLVFVYCDTIAKLKPKVCLLENVSGLVKGNAKSYAKRICTKLNEIGYNVQVFLLNAAVMGVPQKRERVFFIGARKDLRLPKLNLDFAESPIFFRDVEDGMGKPITDYAKNAWEHRQPSDRTIADSKERAGMKVSDFNCTYLKRNEIPGTLTATTGHHGKINYHKPVYISNTEAMKIGTFPLDYDTDGKVDIQYLIGMSVPPVMTAQIAHQIWLQWLSKLNNKTNK
jgi:DNA (cytosine-5)-methyltransferase 1